MGRIFQDMMGNGMHVNLIIQNQSKEDALSAGGAFRQAYALSKRWKGIIWISTLILAVSQVFIATFAAIIPFDLTPWIVALLILTITFSTFGKELRVHHYQEIGANAQRLHEYYVFGGQLSKPANSEIPPALVKRFSEKWFRSNGSDKENLKTWWSTSIGTLPRHAALALAFVSTTSWESELRKRYQVILLFALVGVIGASVFFGFYHDYKLSEYVINVLAPLTPFIAVLLDECLANRKSKRIADHTYRDSSGLWERVVFGQITPEKAEEEMISLMLSWQQYRYTATPIFDVLYRASRSVMEDDMVVNTDKYVDDYKQLNLGH